MDLRGQPVPDSLASAVVVYAHGAGKKVETYWASQPCLFVFLRHFACPGCWSQCDQLKPHLAELKRLRIRVVLVALADPARLLPFRERAQLEDAEIDMVTDPSLVCHREAGLLHGVWSTWGPVSIASGARLYASGYFVRRASGDGDMHQQGGALLVDASGRVVFHHVAAHLGDFVDFDALLAEARALRGCADDGRA